MRERRLGDRHGERAAVAGAAVGERVDDLQADRIAQRMQDGGELEGLDGRLL